MILNGHVSVNVVIDYLMSGAVGEPSAQDLNMRLTRANARTVRHPRSGCVRFWPVGHGQKVPIQSDDRADRKTSCRGRIDPVKLQVGPTEAVPGMVVV